MRLRLQTDYSLRVLIYLAHAGRQATVDEIADGFGISRHHVLKVVQGLARLRWVGTTRGRHGGVSLIADPEALDVGAAVAQLEGRRGVLACVEQPAVCRLEPGCRLRRRLMDAEQAFYDALGGMTLADLVRRPAPGHGLSRFPRAASA